MPIEKVRTGQLTDAERLLLIPRYADTADTRIGRRRPPQHQIITDELELVAKDGGALTLYGFGLERRRALIEALRQKTREP